MERGGGTSKGTWCRDAVPCPEEEAVRIAASPPAAEAGPLWPRALFLERWPLVDRVTDASNTSPFAAATRVFGGPRAC